MGKYAQSFCDGFNEGFNAGNSVLDKGLKIEDKVMSVGKTYKKFVKKAGVGYFRTIGALLKEFGRDDTDFVRMGCVLCDDKTARAVHDHIDNSHFLTLRPSKLKHNQKQTLKLIETLMELDSEYKEKWENI